MKQFDLGMSPPANIMTFWLGLAHFTLDFHPSDLWPWPMTLDLGLYL